MLVVENSVDTFHSWDAANPNWMETFWYGAWIPEHALSVYIYHWFRPVLGIYGGGCLIWDGEHHLPWDIPAFYYDVNRPIVSKTDLRSLDLDCGTHLHARIEGQRYETGFKRDEIEVALTFDAAAPAEIVGGTGMTEFFAGHIDQSGYYTGHIRIGSAQHRIDCFGIRDRSWGPRTITSDIRMNYCHGESEQMAFVAYTKPEDGLDKVFRGDLTIGERKLELADGTRQAFYERGRLRRIDMEVVDTQGRRLSGTGTPLNRMVYIPYPGLVTWIHLMRWEFGSHVIYGEEQDVWSLPLWRARNRSARGE